MYYIKSNGESSWTKIDSKTHHGAKITAAKSYEMNQGKIIYVGKMFQKGNMFPRGIRAISLKTHNNKWQSLF